MVRKRTTLRQQAQYLLDRFESRVAPAIEPEWLLDEHKTLKRFIDGTLDKGEAAEAKDVIRNLSIPDYEVNVDPFFGPRFIEDGYKVGSFSWGFMGRNNPIHVERFGEVVVFGRELATEFRSSFPGEPEVLWFAYSRSIHYWSRNITGCVSFLQTVALLEQEFGVLPRLPRRRRRS